MCGRRCCKFFRTEEWPCQSSVGERSADEPLDTLGALSLPAVSLSNPSKRRRPYVNCMGQLSVSGRLRNAASGHACRRAATTAPRSGPQTRTSPPPGGRFPVARRGGAVGAQLAYGFPLSMRLISRSRSEIYSASYRWRWTMYSPSAFSFASKALTLPLFWRMASRLTSTKSARQDGEFAALGARSSGQAAFAPPGQRTHQP